VVVNEVARVYAGALLESAKEKNILDQVAEELKSVVDLMNEDRDFRLYINVPGIPKDAKKEFIGKVFAKHFSEITINFIKILINNDRQGLIEEILESFGELLDEEKNRLRVKVISSAKLDDSLRKKVESSLNDKFRKDIIIEEKIDESILGGIIIRIGDLIIDGSLIKDLKNIKSRLLQSKVRSEVAYED
jgi:F-type H+-transporting ATPase subunit delta